jgi:molecular chaperone GrpE
MIYAATVHSRPSATEQEYLAGWQRARAELLNFKERVRTQQAEAVFVATRKMLEPLLEAIDNLQAVIQHQPAELKDNAWAQGVIHVARQCEQLLSEYQLESVAAPGEPFDPRCHEAIGQVEREDKESGTIAEVVKRGYKLGDRLIRPAQVKVVT